MSLSFLSSILSPFLTSPLFFFHISLFFSIFVSSSLAGFSHLLLTSLHYLHSTFHSPFRSFVSCVCREYLCESLTRTSLCHSTQTRSSPSSLSQTSAMELQDAHNAVMRNASPTSASHSSRRGIHFGANISKHLNVL